MNGKLIVIEGLDGSGKSTQIEILKNRLSALGKNIRQIKLPDYDNKSSTLVKMYLGGYWNAIYLPLQYLCGIAFLHC